MANKRRFTEAEVEYLVKARKFIAAIPDVDKEENQFAMSARVYKKDDPTWQIGGLLVRARVAVPLPGLPRQIPSCALQWHGIRIRCVNFEMRHTNPDGSIVTGWHEHIWNDEDEADRVISASPEITKPDLKAIFRWGLRKWNIEVKEEQLEVE
jgi:hypothetical protein